MFSNNKTFALVPRFCVSLEPDEPDQSSNTALIVVGILAAGLVVFGLGFYFTRRNQDVQQEENLDARQEEAGDVWKQC